MFAHVSAKPDQETITGGTQLESSQTTETLTPSDMERGLKQIADALCELHGLLERYAPAWYTKQYDEKAESALRVVGRF